MTGGADPATRSENRAGAPWTAQGPEEVVPGLHRLPLPLPDAGLKAVNVYALIGSDAVTLIDAGWDDAVSWQALQESLAGIGAQIGDIDRIIVTHCHRDHIGQATTVKRAAKASYALGERERASFTASVRDRNAFRLDQASVLIRAGATDVATQMLERVTPSDFDWDEPDRWMHDGETIRAGDDTLVSIETPGHTVGHISLHDPGRRLLFAGDHILPHITPSIGFEHELRRSALADFLTSLAKVRDLDVGSVLPAHGPVFNDLAGRVDELLAHHEGRLAECARAVTYGGSTAIEVAERIRWTRREVTFSSLDFFNRVLAIRETLAHLYVLEARSEVETTMHGEELHFSITDRADG